MIFFFLLLTFQTWSNNEPYQISLGQLQIPFTQGRSQKIEVDFDVMIHSIYQEIQFYQGDKKLDFEIAFIAKSGSSRRSGMWFSNFKSTIPSQVIEKLKNNLLPGDGITLAVRIPAEDFTFFTLEMSSIDFFQNYEPELLPASIDFTTIYGFQLIEESGSPLSIKLDTSNSEVVKIYAMYKNKPLYKVIHVPGFKTHRRYLGQKEKLFDSKSIRSVYAICDQYNPVYLPEMTWKDKEMPSLMWGKYTLGEGKEISYIPIQDLNNLFFENLGLKNCNSLTLLQFEIIILRPGFDPISIITNSIHEAQIAKLFSTLKEGSSIYFKNLVILDYEGQVFLNPETYSFHIPFTPEFELEMYFNDCPELSFSDKYQDYWIGCGLGFEELMRSFINPSICLNNCQNIPALDFIYRGKMEEANIILMKKIQNLTGYYYDQNSNTVHCRPKIPVVISYANRIYPE